MEGFHIKQLIAILCLISSVSALSREASPRDGWTQSNEVYKTYCAVCHGERMEGAGQGGPLVEVDLIHGESVQALIASISHGFPDQGMPAWTEVLTDQQIKSMALWVIEHRDVLLYSEFNITSLLSIPEEPVETELYTLKLDVVATGIDRLPYAISPLPDGSVLVTEKMRGLRVVSPQGKLSELITGTPEVYDDARGDPTRIQPGYGWLMDVAIHPNYAENGWIYLAYSDRCSDCNEASRAQQRPVSMNVLMRGRIEDGAWVDQEILYQPDLEHYTWYNDTVAGGRIAFDHEGFVFFSIGWKSMEGPPSLRSPHGKILRLHDDGRIPTDNPYFDHPSALKTIWTYGHRTPQGLEFNRRSRSLWGTEHGPRGGDEVNLLLPGRNYGWPLYSLGQNYDGTEVDSAKELGIEVEIDEIEQPVVDLTPSPAVSSFVFYEGAAFPAWENQMIVGSLKAADLYRIVIEKNKLVHRELLIENLARIRDIEIAGDGTLLLLLEHASGGQLIRASPVTRAVAGSKQ
jgi:glucose/arabinose dehydrogenase